MNALGVTLRFYQILVLKLHNYLSITGHCQTIGSLLVD